MIIDTAAQGLKFLKVSYAVTANPPIKRMLRITSVESMSTLQFAVTLGAVRYQLDVTAFATPVFVVADTFVYEVGLYHFITSCTELFLDWLRFVLVWFVVVVEVVVLNHD